MITLSEYKTLKGVITNDYDDRISAMIPILETYLSDYSGWNNITVANMIEYNLTAVAGLQSESLGDHSQTFLTNYPESITRDLRRKVKLR